MSPNSLRSDCRKFAPNIFNKTKCSNCFKQKEEHTAEALECNRAMRKVARNGYLFVAPGWDFSIPLNRTKRWQRRWFVLYDDGELNYSVDEHPDTVPQASIDMTSVLEVAGAEEVTGHAYSLAITAPDRVTFVKAMARDEARAWTNVLAVYTRNKGRHKRNATFPGGQTTTIHQTQALPRSGTPNPIRPRYNSCHSDSVLRPTARWNQDASASSSATVATSSTTTSNTAATNTKSTSVNNCSTNNTVSSCRSTAYRDQPASSASPPTRDKLNSEEKAAARTRTRQQHSVKNNTPTTASITSTINNNNNLKNMNNITSSTVGEDCVDSGPVKSNDVDGITSRMIPDYETSTKRLETLKDIALVLTRPRSSSTSTSCSQPAPTRDSDTDTPMVGPTSPARTPPLRVELPAETLLHLKKGWLMLQQQDTWTKLWFVLCGGALTAWRDPRGEDTGAVPEMNVSLGQVTSVTEEKVQRNYGFQIRLWNDAVHTLSAVTSGIRSNWLLAVRRAAGLDELPPRPTPTPTQRSLIFSSDEEYRTASEGSSIRRESVDWGAAPSSPPLARTPMSRVKERARSRSNHRSKSSPPSSRTSTLDSVSTDELLAADELQRLHATLQRTERQLHTVNTDKIQWQTQLKEKEDILNETLDKYEHLNRDYLAKQHANIALQQELNCVNERLRRGIEENDYLFKKLQELEGLNKHSSSYGSLSDLTNIDLDLDFNNISKDVLMDEYNNLKLRFEKAVQEIRAMKRELRDSHIKFDDLELSNITLKQDLKRLEDESQAQNTMMAARIQDLTAKFTASEKQVRNLKSKLQDSREKRRSLSLKGRESFSINKEVEDKITELEAKILSLETDKNGAINKRLIKPTKKQIKRDRSNERASPVDERSQRRLRRKSLDSATTSEPMKVLIRLSSLESKVANICDKPSNESLATSTESLNFSNQELKLVTESESNSKILALESTIETAKQKLNECVDQIGVLKHARRQIAPLAERLAPLEQTLTEVGNILKSTNSVSPAEVDVISESVMSVVKSFEKLLSDKLTELSVKRRSLRDSGKLTTQNSLNLIAEKLAYESVLISRIHEALNTAPSEESRFSARILKRELLETGQLAQQLHAKLAGVQPKVPVGSKISEEHLTRVITRKLIQIGFLTNNNRKITLKESQNDRDFHKGLDYLLAKQKEINLLLQKYKSSKLEQLAYSLALETMEGVGLDEVHVKEAWKIAQETVSSELIQAEISHVMLRMAQTYSAQGVCANQGAFFSLFASERAALELWSEVVESHLASELDRGVAELRSVLSKQSSWRRRLEHERPRPRHLLAEFADILAHKALVDARIAVLTGEVKPQPTVGSEDKTNNTYVASLIESERYLWLMEDSGVLESNALLDAEWTAVYARCEARAASEASEGPTKALVTALNGVEQQVARLQGAMISAAPEGEKSSLDIVGRCEDLQQRLAALPLTTRSCTQCEHLKDSLHRLSREHEAEVAVHETSQAQLRERARQLEHRLGTLDSEYAKQLEQLRSAYRETLTTPIPSDDSGSGAGLRARYQAEIEQLRALCEKGLAAVESSHRRVVAELQDKHRRERDQLRLEKEQALAEETQATLAALDAMRKAHEHEVRREVGKFKADFLRKLQATHDLGALHQEHEQEMRDIKQEILALSERYSVKCVESASLEEQLCSVHQQLAQAHHHIQQLDSRNKQLTESLATVAVAAGVDEPYHHHRQDRVSRRSSSAIDGCKPKINPIRNPQLSPMQN